MLGIRLNGVRLNDPHFISGALTLPLCTCCAETRVPSWCWHCRDKQHYVQISG
jgi:hypothetical protein